MHAGFRSGCAISKSMAFTVRDGVLPPLLDRILEMYLGWSHGSYVPWAYVRPMSLAVIGGMNHTRVVEQSPSSGGLCTGGVSLELLKQLALASAAAAVAGCRSNGTVTSNIEASVGISFPSSSRAAMFGDNAADSSVPSEPINTFGIASIVQLMFCRDHTVLQRLKQATTLARRQRTLDLVPTDKHPTTLVRALAMTPYGQWKPLNPDTYRGVMLIDHDPCLFGATLKLAQSAALALTQRDIVTAIRQHELIRCHDLLRIVDLHHLASECPAKDEQMRRALRIERRTRHRSVSAAGQLATHSSAQQRVPGLHLVSDASISQFPKLVQRLVEVAESDIESDDGRTPGLGFRWVKGATASLDSCVDTFQTTRTAVHSFEGEYG